MIDKVDLNDSQAGVLSLTVIIYSHHPPTIHMNLL